MTPNHPLAARFLRHARWAQTTTARATWTYNDWTRWLDTRHTKLVDASRDDCDEYLEQRTVNGLAPASVQVDWRMLKALYRWLYDEGETDTNPMHRVKPPRIHETPVQVLASGDFRKLVATCDRRREDGRRDEAILSLLWWSGLRRSEVCNLDLESLSKDLSTVTIGSATFTTKTRKMRTVPIAAETQAAIDRYLSKRGDDPGPLFLSMHGVTHDDRRIQPNSISLMLRRRSARANLGRHVGAHEFRRAWTVRTRQAGVSDLSVMAMAGWSTSAMLARYSRMQKEELAEAEFRAKFDTSALAARDSGGRRIKRRGVR